MRNVVRLNASQVAAGYIGDVVGQILGDYNDEIDKGMHHAVDVTMDELVKETRAVARSRHYGRRKGQYSRMITQKLGKGGELPSGLQTYSRVWYVRGSARHGDYRLSHLLNNGHGGPVPYEGDPFITEAHGRACKRFEEMLKEVVDDAGR